MKSLTLFEGGYDKCVIRRHPDVFFGTKPIGEHLKFEIGLKLNSPAILQFLSHFQPFQYLRFYFVKHILNFLYQKEALGLHNVI